MVETKTLTEEAKSTRVERIDGIDKAVPVYSIRRGFEWATIYIRPLKKGVEVVANSSFGVYGHAWGCITCNEAGPQWREFLSDMEYDYFMGKMAGNDRMMREVQEHEFKDQAMAAIAYDFDAGELTQAQREELESELEDACNNHCDPRTMFEVWNDSTGGLPSERDWHDCLKIGSSQTQAFWDVIWLPMMSHLQGEMA